PVHDWQLRQRRERGVGRVEERRVVSVLERRARDWEHHHQTGAAVAELPGYHVRGALRLEGWVGEAAWLEEPGEFGDERQPERDDDQPRQDDQLAAAVGEAVERAEHFVTLPFRGAKPRGIPTVDGFASSAVLFGSGRGFCSSRRDFAPPGTTRARDGEPV